jgi:hypothetical protein
MLLNSQENRRAVAIAAYQGRHFCGYAVKTDEGWTAVAALGMSWSKLKVATANDARMWLRTTTHAGKFDMFSSITDLREVIDDMPEYNRPAIEPESIAGTSSLFLQKLQAAEVARLG